MKIKITLDSVVSPSYLNLLVQPKKDLKNSQETEGIKN